MMRRWVESYTQESSLAPLGAMSAVVHLVAIALWVVATLPAAGLPRDSLANRVYYIPPPNPVPGSGARHEVIHFLTLGAGGTAGEATAPTTGDSPLPTNPSEDAGAIRPDSVIDSLPTLSGQQDSVFTILEVDTAVARWSNSAAPAYPPLLLAGKVSGIVSVRYIVDTTGLADTASFRVVNTTHRDFAAAVRSALPNMRFQPAKIGNVKVRQLVEQQFTFRVETPTDTVKPPVKEPGRRPEPIR